MSTATTFDQVKIEHLDERVRCGSALFTPFRGELEVRFLNPNGEADVVKYDLGSVPFNHACLLYNAQRRPTNYLVCNQWGTLHVRYGPIPPGQRYPALLPRKLPRNVRLVDDILNAPHVPSSAMHPNPRIPLLVKVCHDLVRIELMEGALTAARFDIKLRKLPRGRWYTPTDKHGQRLPVRLRRPAIASLFGISALDVEWME
jgi:hypothetical protein